MSLIPLHAGGLSLAFQPTDASVRYVHAGPHEVLRGIGAPVRDHVWTTIPPEVSDLAVERGPDSFRVTFTVRCRAHRVDFRWRGEIVGTADGTLTFAFDGEALSDFERNRIGFCVLHPAGAAGAACTVEHTDGRQTAAAFPREISPHQPFFDILALAHEFAPGLRAHVQLEGDTFEMEDQRNWTDASFKTYCTPLALPRPVLVRQGTRVQQCITLRIDGPVPAAPTEFAFPWQAPPSVALTIGDAPRTPLPRLGTLWNAGAPAEPVLAALRSLRLSHLRVDLWLADPASRERLREASAAAAALDLPLEPALFTDDSAARQSAELMETLATLEPSPRIARWLVFHEARSSTPPELVALFRRSIESTRFAAPVGGGATDNFTELNREPAVAQLADFTVHACNPQVHAFDAASLVETLAIQGLTVDNARRISGGRNAVVSSVTLTPRWRPGAAGGPPHRPSGLMPFREDPRHNSPLAAAWTVGSVAALAAHGAASVTYFEAVGPNGIVAPDGTLLPAGEALQLLAPHADALVTHVTSSHPLRIAAVGLEHEDRRYLLVTNLAGEEQQIMVGGAWEARASTPALGVRLLEFP